MIVMYMYVCTYEITYKVTILLKTCYVDCLLEELQKYRYTL